MPAYVSLNMALIAAIALVENYLPLPYLLAMIKAAEMMGTS